MVMTEEEIRTSYRDAKHKKRQIRILSELSLRPIKEIERIVNRSEGEPIKRKKPNQRWDQKEVDILLEMHAKGIDLMQVSREIDRPYKSVVSKLHELRLKQICE